MTPAGDSLPDLSTTEALARLVHHAHAMGREPERVEEGTPLLQEGRPNRTLYILLEGTARHQKETPRGETIVVDTVGPGSLVGILSFWTGQPSFTNTIAASALTFLRLERDDFDRQTSTDHEFTRLTQQLFVSNLTDRYRHVVGLNLDVAALTEELREERNALQAAIADLHRTRNKLIHKEKLATMGQLLAGIAHEINNPAASLVKSVELVLEELPAMMDHDPVSAALFTAGTRAPFLGSGETREAMERLEQQYPGLGRGMYRRLSRLNQEDLAHLERALRARDTRAVEGYLRAFEVGAALHSADLAQQRIVRLVQSLKSYSRQDGSDDCSASLEECIRDTATVLNHRLKHYDLRLEITELPRVQGCPGEVNQILTNLLTNACEATDPGRQITVRTGIADEYVWLEVEDQGHGIPPELLESIFDLNVTTRRGGGDMGLGLGLAISRDLALKHHGALTAVNVPRGGARFRLQLPMCGNS